MVPETGAANCRAGAFLGPAGRALFARGRSLVQLPARQVSAGGLAADDYRGHNRYSSCSRQHEPARCHEPWESERMELKVDHIAACCDRNGAKDEIRAHYLCGTAVDRGSPA